MLFIFYFSVINFFANKQTKNGKPHKFFFCKKNLIKNLNLKKKIALGSTKLAFEHQE